MYEHRAIYGYECKEGRTKQGAARLPGGEYPAIIVNSGTCPVLVQEVAVLTTTLRRVIAALSLLIMAEDNQPAGLGSSGAVTRIDIVCRTGAR